MEERIVHVAREVLHPEFSPGELLEVDVRDHLGAPPAWVPAVFLNQEEDSTSHMVVVIDAPAGHAWHGNCGVHLRCANYRPWVRRISEAPRRQDPVRLTAEETKRLLGLLESPPAPTQELVDAMALHGTRT